MLLDPPGVHDHVLMVATVEVDLCREDDDQRQQQQYHFHRLAAAVHEVPVEHVRIVRRGQPVLQGSG